jgi:hypothetical protein
MILKRLSRTIQIAVIASSIINLIAIGNATTKGLNQIVTPDIQPKGQLSISYQQQDPNVGDSMEAQEELGLTNNFEIAIFEGAAPAVQVANAELGLINRGPWLLSTGFTGWTTNGNAPQPFVESGYYYKALQLDLGLLRGISQNANLGNPYGVYGYQWLSGIAYSPSNRVKLAIDYQSADSNFLTAGFTYNITPNLSLNPAIYITNSTPKKGFGYVVLTWTITAFHG